MAYRDYKKTKRIIKNFTENIEGKGEGDSKLQPSKNVTPTTEAQYVKADTGYDAITQVNVAAVNASIDSNITAENIKKDVSILGVTGSYDAPTIPEYTGTYNVTENNVTLETEGKQLTDNITVNIEMPENPLDDTTVGRLYEVVENSGEKELEDTDDNYIYYYEHGYDPETGEDVSTLQSEELVENLALLYFDSTVNKFELTEGSWYHYVNNSSMSFDEYTFEYEKLYYYTDYGTFDQVSGVDGEGTYVYNGNGSFQKLDNEKVYYINDSGEAQETYVENYGYYFYNGNGDFASFELTSGLSYINIESGMPYQNMLELDENSLYIYGGETDFEKVDLPEEGQETTIYVDGVEYKLSRHASE